MTAEYVCRWFFFFFQAEDGIRGTSVTGVQTCALPISLLRAPGSCADASRVRALSWHSQKSSPALSKEEPASTRSGHRPRAARRSPPALPRELSPGHALHEFCRANGRLPNMCCFRDDFLTLPLALGCAPTAKSHGFFALATKPPTGRFPSFPLQEWRFASLCFLIFGERKPGLRAFAQSLEIPPVLVKDERCRRQGANGHRERRCVARCPQEVNQQRHRCRRGNRAQRNITPENHDQQKEDDRSETRQRREHQKHACGRGDSFAALEFQPNREAVARERGDAGDHHPPRAMV